MLCSEFLLGGAKAVASKSHSLVLESLFFFFLKLLASEYETNHKRSHPFPWHSPFPTKCSRRWKRRPIGSLGIKIAIFKCKGYCEEPNGSNLHTCCVQHEKLLRLWSREISLSSLLLTWETPGISAGWRGEPCCSPPSPASSASSELGRGRFEGGCSFSGGCPFLSSFCIQWCLLRKDPFHLISEWKVESLNFCVSFRLRNK